MIHISTYRLAVVSLPISLRISLPTPISTSSCEKSASAICNSSDSRCDILPLVPPLYFRSVHIKICSLPHQTRLFLSLAGPCTISEPEYHLLNRALTLKCSDALRSLRQISPASHLLNRRLLLIPTYKALRIQFKGEGRTWRWYNERKVKTLTSFGACTSQIPLHCLPVLPIFFKFLLSSPYSYYVLTPGVPSQHFPFPFCLPFPFPRADGTMALLTSILVC